MLSWVVFEGPVQRTTKDQRWDWTLTTLDWTDGTSPCWSNDQFWPNLYYIIIWATIPAKTCSKQCFYRFFACIFEICCTSYVNMVICSTVYCFPHFHCVLHVQPQLCWASTIGWQAVRGWVESWALAQFGHGAGWAAHPQAEEQRTAVKDCNTTPDYCVRQLCSLGW